MNQLGRKDSRETPGAELLGQTAVVTGASKGIGRAIVLELAGAGANVLVHGNSSRDAAHEVAQSARSLGVESHVVLCDLSEPERHERLVEEAWNWHGPIDIWVNNAGADVLTGPLAEATFDEKLERLWRVDVLATVRLSRLAGQGMKDRGGVILNMGWDQAEHGMAGDSGQMFGTVKGSIIAFTRSLAQSLAPGVRANCLAPGWIKTDWGQQASPTWQSRACADSLLGRWGSMEDVARTARFLVSPSASFVNGQIVAVNGGFRYGSPLLHDA